MFGLKNKEKKVDAPVNATENKDDVIILPADLGEESAPATPEESKEVALKAETLPAEKGKDNLQVISDEKGKAKAVDFSAFYELARILNTTVENVKDECCMFQIKKLMAKLSKVIVRFNVNDAELERIINNGCALNIKETVIAPAYLPALKRKFKNSKLENVNVCALIDFPFGESLFKSKISDIKDAVRMGVDSVTVMMPLMILEKERIKEFKKQVKKIGKMKKGHAGIAFSAMDMTEEEIKTVMKFTEKSKCSHVTFVFGEASEQMVKNKFKEINKYKSKKVQTQILGNVEHIEAVVELFKMGVENLLTPYADDIGKYLIKDFGVKCVKLQ